jgi:hypothetical protein
MLCAFVRTSVLVLFPLCFFTAAILAGRWARADLQAQQDGLVAFAAIECTPPQGMSRAELLDEVQYLGACPDRLSLADAALPERLVQLFKSHPRIEEVRLAEVRPYQSLRVELMFREPVLLVEVRPGKGLTPQYRSVDRHGVLLPGSAMRAPLPVLETDVQRPAGPAGALWGDQRVADAAALAGLILARDTQQHWQEAHIDLTAAGLVLHHQGRCIVWGKPPGQEGGKEAAAEVKWQRLQEVLGDHQVADGRQYDLRPIHPADGGLFALARP